MKGANRNINNPDEFYMDFFNKIIKRETPDIDKGSKKNNRTSEASNEKDKSFNNNGKNTALINNNINTDLMNGEIKGKIQKKKKVKE